MSRSLKAKETHAVSTSDEVGVPTTEVWEQDFNSQANEKGLGPGTEHMQSPGVNRLAQPNLNNSLMGSLKIEAVTRLLGMRIAMKDNVELKMGMQMIEQVRGYFRDPDKLDRKVSISIGNPDYSAIMYHRRGDKPYLWFIAVKAKNGRIVGDAMLWKYDKVFSTRTLSMRHIFLDPKHRGKSLGVDIYMLAINAYGAVCSSDDMGIAAVKTWRALSKVAKVKLYECEFDAFAVKIIKEVQYTWGADGIPVVSGRPITSDTPNDYREYIFRATK